MVKNDKKGEEKLEPEGTPPLDKRSMVSEADLIERIKDVKNSEEDVKIPKAETLLLFIFEKLYLMDEKLAKMITIFEGVKGESVADNIPIAPETSSAPTSGSASNQVEEIMRAFEPIKELVRIDTEQSAQYVLIYPNGFLGADKFAKVGRVSKDFGGQYVSQGKESHFKIPKLVESKEDESSQQEVDAKKSSSTPTGDVRMMFPEDLEDMLSFEEKEDYIKIKPRQFLGSDNFAKIASIIRGVGGEYVSAGKESHFRVPIKKD